MSLRTLTCAYLRSSTEWFTVGKSNVAAMPPPNQAKHAVRMCMAEVGHVGPRWLTQEDGRVVALLPDEFYRWDDATQIDWCAACDRAIWMAIERFGDEVIA